MQIRTFRESLGFAYQVTWSAAHSILNSVWNNVRENHLTERVISICRTTFVSSLSGDTHQEVFPNNRTIRMLGGDTISVRESDSTLRFVTTSGGYPISPFVVGPDNQSGYQSIQSAVEAAEAAGQGTVYVQPGQYVENLTFTTGKVTLLGAVALGDEGQCEIIGQHTPPISGSLVLRNFKLTAVENVFSSSADGKSHIALIDSTTNVENGYVFHLLNWTGVIELFDINSVGSNDGCIYNLSGASFNAYSTTLGFGSTKPMVISGPAFCQSTSINCPVQFVYRASFTFYSAIFMKGVSCYQQSTGSLSHCTLYSSECPAMIMCSSQPISIFNTVIDSSNNPAIDGKGAGSLSLGNITFVKNSVLGDNLTLIFSRIRAGDTYVTSLNSAGRVTGAVLEAADDTIGSRSSTTITNGVVNNLGEGILSIRSTTANSGSNTGFLKLYVDGQAVFVPYFSNINPQ